jgi:flagellar basal-body rod modification protein FlgD
MAEGVPGVTSAGWTRPGDPLPEAGNGATSEVDKEMFLQLLVAQIKHQDPLNPADGIEFLTQLAEFSGLEQMMAVRKELEEIHSSMESFAAEPTEEDDAAGSST